MLKSKNEVATRLIEHLVETGKISYRKYETLYMGLHINEEEMPDIRFEATADVLTALKSIANDPIEKLSPPAYSTLYDALIESKEVAEEYCSPECVYRDRDGRCMYASHCAVQPRYFGKQRMCESFQKA